MNQHFGLMIPGAEESGETKSVSAPWDMSPIATVSTIGPAGAEQALANGYAIARDRDRWLPPARRIEILEKTALIMEQRFEELALESAREGGKPLIDSRVEVARGIDGVRSCVECIRTEAGREIPMNLNPSSAQRLAFTHKEPIGLVMAVSAFNHPFNLIVHQIMPGVAAGCPVIVKPAEDTPLSCFRIVEILREAGLADEYCQPLVTETLDVATQLVTDARVAFFSFIGSAGVGWMLRSKLAPGTRAALEHGGPAPAIIAPDADLDEILPLLAKGGFYHAGQVCVSVQRVFAHRSIAERVAAGLGELAAAMKIGDPTSADTEIGPLIRPGEADRVAEWVDEAVNGGAQLICGGNRPSDTTYECTVLYDPPADSRVSTHEVFGPVVCVYPYDDVDEAISRANGLPYAFQAAVMTKDIDTAMHCYKRLDAAAVMINDHTAFRVDWMPFAGLRQSGLGVGGIPYTFEEMQISKMMVLRSPAL